VAEVVLERQVTLLGRGENPDLQAGMDFRLPEYRREVFHRFYEFHLRHAAHPGGVYYIFRALRAREGWDQEAALWFAFINGNTQNPVTSHRIFTAFPSLKDLRIERLDAWFKEHYTKLAFDTDRRYHKKGFVAAVSGYKQLLRGSSQGSFFNEVVAGQFMRAWDLVINNFYGFGRLSTFSYLEYLRIMGLPLVCDRLFLDDMQGSKSHRNGLCKVLGRDDLDWHDSNPAFNGHYPKPLLRWLESEADLLLREAQARLGSTPLAPDVGYFTLESALCTYKSWYRPNRRYPNVYNDLFHDRIKLAEQTWGEPHQLFWDVRRESLPANLRQEDNPADCGVAPKKQNHYRLTGQVIMMDEDWPCFRNDFNDEVRRAQA
jgi:hypothetical protein